MQRFTCTRTRSGTLPLVEGLWLAGMATLQKRQRRGKKSETVKRHTQKGDARARRVAEAGDFAPQSSAKSFLHVNAILRQTKLNQRHQQSSQDYDCIAQAIEMTNQGSAPYWILMMAGVGTLADVTTMGADICCA